MRAHLHPSVTFLAALMLGVTIPAAAQFTITSNTGRASAEAKYPGWNAWLPEDSMTTTFGPNGGAAVAQVDPLSFGHIRGVQTGYGLNAVAVDARPQDMNYIYWSAFTDYDVTVENTSIFHPDLGFQFHINGGRLELLDPSLLFSGMAAHVSATIFTISPGFSGFLWWWELTLQSDGHGNVSSTVDHFDDPLGLGAPALSAITIANDRATLDIGSFTAATNLGRMAPGASASVSYQMRAVVRGPGFGTGGVAMLGDPWDLNGDYGAGIEFTAVAAPEPSTVWLLAAGLISIGAVRRTTSKRNTFTRSESWH